MSEGETSNTEPLAANSSKTCALGAHLLHSLSAGVYVRRLGGSSDDTSFSPELTAARRVGSEAEVMDISRGVVGRRRILQLSSVCASESVHWNTAGMLGAG